MRRVRGGLRHQLRAILVLAWLNGLLPIARSPLWVVSTVAMPISLLILLAILYRGAGLIMGIVGGLVWTVLSSGTSLIGDAAYYRLELKFQQMIVATPTNPLAYAIGLALSEVVFALPGIALFAVLLVVTVPINQWGATAIAVSLALLWYSVSTLAFYSSTLFAYVRYTWAVVSIVTLVLGILPPVYYPATYLGKAWWLAYLVPTSASALVMQDAVGITHYSPAQIGLAYLSEAAWCLVGTLLVIRAARWRSP
ncbi:MAG: ABC transporter [Vulcanisaeta sp.]|nr:ABC transporter [Vulcanisaeta sp.]